MKIGFLFPGQGAQQIGMGKDLYEKYQEYRNIYEKVKQITGIDIFEITLNDEEKLNQTKYTQLAILTNSLAILEILKKYEIKPESMAGLSLGEYTALIYGNVFSFEDGIKIVEKRGEYMQNMVPSGNWKMAAIMGLDEKQINDVISKVENGFVKIANFNYQDQIVISGEEEAVLQAEEIAKNNGAKKVRILNTSGPFHTEKLIESSNALKRKFEKIQINEIKTKIYKNLDGKLYDNTDDVSDILAKHIINPVRFTNIIENMLNDGIDTFIEIGPGKTLTGFIKRTKIDKEIRTFNINNCENLEQTIEILKEAENG